MKILAAMHLFLDNKDEENRLSRNGQSGLFAELAGVPKSSKKIIDNDRRRVIV